MPKFRKYVMRNNKARIIERASDFYHLLQRRLLEWQIEAKKYIGNIHQTLVSLLSSFEYSFVSE